jgi:hypothetical protein
MIKPKVIWENSTKIEGDILDKVYKGSCFSDGEGSKDVCLPLMLGWG